MSVDFRSNEELAKLLGVRINEDYVIKGTQYQFKLTDKAILGRMRSDSLWTTYAHDLESWLFMANFLLKNKHRIYALEEDFIINEMLERDGMVYLNSCVYVQKGEHIVKLSMKEVLKMVQYFKDSRLIPDKEKPQKPICTDKDLWIYECPICGNTCRSGANDLVGFYCSNCGQCLDWCDYDC